MARIKQVPLYHQIKTTILEAIETGHFKAGDQIPSERELTDQHGVSRMTARQALAELETMGYLHRIQGRGTFVAVPKIDQPLLALTSFTEDMRSRGLRPGSQVLSLTEIVAGEQVGHALGILKTDRVIRLERLRLASGEPMALETAHIPTALCPGILDMDLAGQSLYAILREKYGYQLAKAQQTLEAVTASTPEAKLLKIREGTPVLLMERIARDGRGRAIEFVRSLYRSDRYRFTAELIRSATVMVAGEPG